MRIDMKVFSNLRTSEEAHRNSQMILFKTNKRYFHFTGRVIKLWNLKS